MSTSNTAKAFVTGGTGFIGSHVVRELLRHNIEVTCLVRETSSLDRLEGLDIELAYGDLTDYDSLYQGMKGHDQIYHLAAYYSARNVNAELMERINVDGTRNVLRAMQELEIPEGVYCSTVGALGDTYGRVEDESHEHDQQFRSDYTRTKYLAHKVAEEFIENGLPLIIAMPGAVYGPGDTSIIGEMISDYLHRKLPASLKSPTTYSFVHVEDVARGIYLAIEKGEPGESYILAGQIYSITDFLDYLGELSGVAPPKLSIGIRTAKVFAHLGRWLPASLRKQLLSPQEVSMADGITFSYGHEKAKRELGWEPRPLEEGLRETIDWYLRQPA